MNTYYYEPIGFEPIIPDEIIDFLNVNKMTVIEQSIEYESSHDVDNLILDEHERAMAA